jgi:flagellin
MTSALTNLSAMQAHKNLEAASSQISQSVYRLTSGQRIASAMDDPAGLSIAVSLNTKVVTLGAAANTAANAQSLLQIADGALSVAADMLTRYKQIATQGVSGTNSSAQYTAIQTEATNIIDQLNLVSSSTRFDDTVLTDGSFGSQLFMVGTNVSATPSVTTDDVIAVDLSQLNLQASNLGLTTTIVDLDSSAAASNEVDNAITIVAGLRASLGAMQSRFNQANNNIQVGIINLTNAHSQYADTDIGAESTVYAQLNLLSQASTSMLAQSNSRIQSLLQLINQQ